MPEKGLIVVGYGAGAIDRHMHAGQVWPGYVPGAKADFTPADHQRFSGMHPREYREHPGGNWMNTGNYLRSLKDGFYQEVRSCTLMGENDVASQAIRKHMERMGLVDYSIIVPNYEPSVSVIQRGKDEKGNVMDRMVRGRPRGGEKAPQGNHFTPEEVERASRGADVVVIASLKSQIANRTVLHHTPITAALSINLGSSEVSTPEKAAEARRTLYERKATLLAINDEEIQQLFGEPDTPPRELAARATENGMADNVAATCGSDGVLFAHNGDVKGAEARVEFSPVAKINPRKIISTLGAGDRAHAIALDEILRGTPPEQIPERIARGALEVLRVAGAHEDLYSRQARLKRFGRQLCASFRLARA